VIATCSLAIVAAGGSGPAIAMTPAARDAAVSVAVTRAPNRTITSKAIITKSKATTNTSKATKFTEKATISNEKATVRRITGKISRSDPFALFSNRALSGGGQIAAGPDGAFWFSGGTSSLDRITADGAITTYTNAAYLSQVDDVISGPDGAIWFDAGFRTGDLITAIIERIGVGGTITTYSFPTLSEFSSVTVTAGPDGAIWFTTDNDFVGRLSISGAVTIYSDATIDNAGFITAGADGALWFTDNGGVGNPLGRISTGGSVTIYADHASFSDVRSITTGPNDAGSDAAIWFYNDFNHALGAVAADGAVTTYTGPGTIAQENIISGPDNTVWFGADRADELSLGRLTTAGIVTDYYNLGNTSNILWLTAGAGDSIWFTTGRIGTDVVGHFTIPVVLRLAALGDSYSSGEGTLKYDKDSGKCHRGPDAWPRLLASSAPDIKMEAHLACSGATSEALAGTVKGQPDQISELARLRPRPTLITMTMGGNDVRFGDVLADCYHTNCIRDGTLKRAASAIADEKTRLLGDYDALIKADSSATILIVGYPRIFEQDHFCGNKELGLGFKISELAELNKLGGQLDAVIREAAAEAGVRYVDVTDALKGHELCSKDSWVFQIGIDHVWHPQEGGHPTAPGQRAIADIVRKYIDSHL
jgi:streptogramin lyase